MNNIQ
jgi:hypothetical protein